MRYTILLLVCHFVSIIAMAQSVEVRKYYLESNHETYKPMRHKFYFKSFDNKGKVKHEKTEQYIQEYFKDKSICNNTSNKNWLKQELFCSLSSESEADVVVSGTYSYTCGANVFEKRMTEKTGTARLPYFEDMTKNAADLKIILSFSYKDGTPSVTDTISITKASEKKSLGELEADIDKAVKFKIAYYFDATDAKSQYINLPKVKIKDKALKEEFASVKGLLKNGEYVKAGVICKKVNGIVNSPASSVMVGICYELLGNYPKANEYYKSVNDFHIKSRMKKSMKLLNYAESIGYTPEFVEF